MSERKISIANWITIIVMIIFIMGLVFGFMEVYEHFVLGWDKDCREQIKGLDSEYDYPIVCQDYSKYHMMLIFSVGLLTMAFALFAMLFSYLYQNKILDDDDQQRRRY